MMSTGNHEPDNPYTSDRYGSASQNSSYQQPYQYQQPQYQGQNQQYGQTPGYGYPMVDPRGAELAQTSMILGIISLFVVGIILGPIAIVKANQAERDFNTSATVGKVTGWIGTIFGLLGLIYLVFVFIAVFVMAGTSTMYGDFA